MKNRPLLLPAVLAVGLWIAGLVVINSFSDKIPHHPTDAQLLTWIQGNQNPIISGGWLWMIGCLSFLWFAALLRPRLAEAEGGPHTYTTLAFAGACAGDRVRHLDPGGRPRRGDRPGQHQRGDRRHAAHTSPTCSSSGRSWR